MGNTSCSAEGPGLILGQKDQWPRSSTLASGTHGRGAWWGARGRGAWWGTPRTRSLVGPRRVGSRLGSPEDEEPGGEPRGRGAWWGRGESDTPVGLTALSPLHFLLLVGLRVTLILYSLGAFLENIPKKEISGLL